MRTLLACLALVAVRAPAQQPTKQQAALHEIYKTLIETNTEDSAGVGSVTAATQPLAERFRSAGFPDADIHLLGPTPDKQSLVVRYHGTGAKKPLLLLAHLDVVIARTSDWSTDPFTLVEKDGYYQARGSIDDKAMAAIFVANLVRFKQEGFVPNRDIILALTPDEEKSGELGAAWLVKNHRDLIDAAIAINEGGGGILRNSKRLYLQVVAAEKVFTDFTLTARNRGGHSSLPRPDNAIYELTAALTRLSGYTFPVQLNDVTRTFFERTATIESAENANAMRAILRDPSDSVAAATLSRDSFYNSVLRTTCVATRLAGGHADNALPQVATANVNCRIFPKVSGEEVRARLISAIADTGIEVSPPSDPTPAVDPAPLTPEIMGPVTAITKSMFGDIPVIPQMTPGASDSRFLLPAGIPAYGVSGLFVDLDDFRIHGRDERVLQKSLYDSQEFLYRLVKMLSSASP